MILYKVFPCLNILVGDDKVSQLRGQRQPFHSPLLKNEPLLFFKWLQSESENICIFSFVYSYC